MSPPSPFKYTEADSSTGFLLWKITSLWQQKLAAVLAEFGITQTQYAILASLRWFETHEEPTTQAHLVEHAKIEKMTLSKAIRRLEEEGFVTREGSSLDGRATNVLFTTKGKRVAQRAIVAVENADEEFFSCLSKEQLKTYAALTSTLIADNAG